VRAPSFPSDVVADAIRNRSVDGWLEKAGVAVVHLGLVDSSGVLREKRLSAAAAVRAFEDGWSFIDAVDWWDPADRLWGTGGSSGQPALVDASSGRPYPFEPDAALFLADFTGPLTEFSPRAQLARTLDRARSVGVTAEVGWEFECIVLDGVAAGADGGVVPQPAMMANRCWSAHTPASEAPLLRDLEALLAAGSVPLDHCCAELGPGCLELATAHTEAGRSADDALLAKVYTKAFFDQRGQTATFMAQMADDCPGLGGHPTLTLHATDDGRPLLGMDGSVLSGTTRSAIAGVVTLLPELFPMVAATPNSYRRFAPGNWAPGTATWGMGNYSCGLRVVHGTRDRVRLELRAPGADTSPHLCLAMFLGAAVWGIENDLEPPPPIDPPDDGRAAPGAPRFPRSLAEAVERFVVSDAADDLFGPAFVAHHAGACLAEDQACRRLVPVGEQRRYLSQA
jgi:glutamine synthetase